MIHRIHPELRPHLPALLEIIRCAKEVTDDPDRLADLIAEDQEWLAAFQWASTVLVHNRITGLGGNVFAVPMLDPDYCDELVDHSVRLGAEIGHRPNMAEEADYQIPELVLADVAPELFAEVHEAMAFVNVWSALAFQTEIGGVSSIQFAKYEPSDTPRGNWHHDRDSDISAVVSLAPELHVGGGTEIRLNLVESFNLDPLPKGYALLFNGKLVQHRGRAVEDGVRHLLVCWLKTPDLSVSKTETSQVE